MVEDATPLGGTSLEQPDWRKVMRELPPRARAYIIGSYLAGLLACCWLLLSYDGALPQLNDWLLAAVLAAGAATCQVFVVARTNTSGNRSDHLTPAPILAALLLVPHPLLALVLIITWLPEWYFFRRPWYIQLWNIAAYLIAGVLARSAFRLLTGHDHLAEAGLGLSAQAWHVLLLIPIFLGTQTVMLAWVLKLARGKSFQDSGLFEPSKLLVEGGLACVGLAFAIAWLLDPLYGVATALPLVLIFQALHVPNLKEEAATDSKTGLANMRYFNQIATRTVERAERSGETFSLLMCDLDYLRNINNTFGHQAGDTVLLGIADILRRKVGPNDAAARFGGEEFVILLADTHSAAASQLAEELRAELEETRFEVKDIEAPISATLSIGVATYPADGRTIEALMHEADLAVYQGKRDGRNRVVVAGRVSRELAADWAREHLVHTPAPDVVTTLAPTSRPFWNFINEVTRNSINTQVASMLTVRRARPPEALTPARAWQPAPASQRPAPALLLLITLIVVCGLAGLLPIPPIRSITWAPLLLFTALTVVASELAVDTHGKGKTSVAVVAKLSAALLFGAPGILATALASALTLKIKARSPWHRMFFNFGTFILSAEAAHRVFTLLVGDTLTGVTIERGLVPATLAGLTFYLINHLLLCLVRGFSERRVPWLIWHADYRWLWPHYAVLGAFGLIIALGYHVFGWIGVIGLMSPLAMMHLAIKQYTERTGVHLDELSQLNDRLTDSYEATLLALSRALDTRDEETEEHSQRVKRYTHLIASYLHITGAELEDILRGALLHDIGKIGVPDAILLKPGRLDERETAMMRQHPEIGYSMITHIPFLAGAARIVLHHHEAYDGSGYPSRLAGTSIPLGARIFAIADTFDAMTSDRPYRAALPIAAARAEIERCRGVQFDPQLVDIFLSIPIAELSAARDNSTVDMIGPVLRGTPEMVLAHG